MSGLIEPSAPQRRFLHKAPGPCLSPRSEHVARLLDGGDDAANGLDRALDEEVDARRLAAHTADVGENPTVPFFDGSECEPPLNLKRTLASVQPPAAAVISNGGIVKTCGSGLFADHAATSRLCGSFSI